MLRPEQMSKVSVTGSKKVMDDVIETTHDLNLLHVSEYDGSWEAFEQGDPASGAEAASDKLVTVRSIESILDVDPEDAGPTRIVTEEALEDELEEIRHRVNELDDRRDELRSDLRELEERIDAVEPFATLGIDLDLLSGYDTLQVAVGHGKRDSVENAVATADALEQYEIYHEEDVVAVFAKPTDAADEDALDDTLVGTDFAALTVPEADGSPQEYVQTLEHRQQQLRSKLNTVEDELEEVKLDAAGFLLAAEEKLSINVQKTEAPLSFATTENAFVAEGWIPTTRFGEFAGALTDAVGNHVEVEEVERASFKSSGEAVRHRPESGSGSPAATDGGHDVTMNDDNPPVVQNNPGAIRPFEVLVKAVGRPNYREFDPTVILFLTFPVFFGFMIGDLGYGIAYTIIGYYLYSNYDSPAFKSMGGVTIAAGLFTMLFGILYGEIFGLHLVAEFLWAGHPPLHKGLQPAELHWALGWLVLSLVVALVHLNIGYIFGFIEEMEFHGFKAALFEKGSWIIGMNGLWLFVFSTLWADSKPDFLFEVFNTGEAAAFKLGFAGFPKVAGYIGLGLFLLGAVLLGIGAPGELVEVFDMLVNVLSYTRIAAVLLAKAGMAFVVNLLFFGVYVTGHGEGAEWHFGINGIPELGAMEHGHEVTDIMFGGLMHGGVAALLGGLLILVVGHVIVLALGVTSAGLQAVRLEYYEFFSKFFEGGGREYEPFGYERQYTTED